MPRERIRNPVRVWEWIGLAGTLCLALLLVGYHYGWSLEVRYRLAQAALALMVIGLVGKYATLFRNRDRT